MPGTDTLLLDVVAWDLVLDANDNIAVARAPYALAQDAASAIRTFLGEVYWDTSIGMPYFGEILGKNPPLALLKGRLEAEAETVPGVVSAKVFVASTNGRVVAGQVQVAAAGGGTSAANFSTVNPQVA